MKKQKLKSLLIMIMMMGTLRLIGHGKKIGFPDVGF